ncbi:MAG: ABC transporter permease [Solobacterium sp.]|jgi:simple sugar transport system permease protein|nr:ABC transporter permease [Solobacterium sp.]
MKKIDLKTVAHKGFNNLKSPLIATFFGLLIGAVVIMSCGENPIQVYILMFERAFINPYYLAETLTRATPVIICALATAMSWRAGYINIGVEGQMVAGTIVAAIVALNMPGPAWIVMIVAWLAGMAAGALYALLPAIIQRKYGASLIIVSLMLNYVANNITSYLVTYPLKDTSGDAMAIQTKSFRDGLSLTRFFTGNTLNFGFVIAIILVILMIFYEKKTILGYESKMTGYNPNFAKYGGVKEKKVMMITMALSGAIGAIAGCTYAFGVSGRFVDGMLTSTNFAWTGLMAALIADLHPIGIVIASIFLSGLQIGGSTLQRSMSIPSEISTIIQCCITLFVSIKIVINFRRKKKTSVAKKGGDEE